MRHGEFTKDMSELEQTELTIAIIDDDKMVLKSLENAIRDDGFSVHAFSDPIKGIDFIEQEKADVVISDICMPDHDGFAVLKSVKESAPECDVIFITAHGQMDIAIRALREGATDFLEKPITGAALRASIERTSKFRALARTSKLLSDKVELLSRELQDQHNDTVMIGKSEQMKQVAQQIIDLADSNATVLITGESGTGKELVARALHAQSDRSKGPYLTANCPSIPEDLFESEMFGHRKGAFTGAIETRSGYIEACHGGTLFLDEIGDLPLKSQAKILRLLEQRTYMPVGEHKEKTADVRIVAATNQPLEELVKEKKFREDLYYRLKVAAIELPPLRKRPCDIPVIALYYALKLAGEMGREVEGLGDSAIAALQSYSFPGNIRELRNTIESTVIHFRKGGMIEAEDLPKLSGSPIAAEDASDWRSGSLKFTDVEKELYEEALSRTNSNVSAAARMLGLSRGKLRRRLEALNMTQDLAE
jgi:DNA-binding NtrC family response regulator